VQAIIIGVGALMLPFTLMSCATKIPKSEKPLLIGNEVHVPIGYQKMKHRLL